MSYANELESGFESRENENKILKNRLRIFCEADSKSQETIRRQRLSIALLFVFLVTSIVINISLLYQASKTLC